MTWHLAVRVGLLLAPPLARALRDGKLTPEEVEQLLAVLLGALLPGSKPSGS